MRQFFNRLLLPIAVAAVTQTSFVSAESIRLVGPNGDAQSAPQYSRDIARNRTLTTNEPLQVVGPTSEKDTLWSIATRLRPSEQVSVQQTLLAIYLLNPQAFDEQNIHSLIPGSTLRIPSLAQVKRVSTEEAINVMAAHKARLDNKGQPAKKASKPTSITKTAVNPDPTPKLAVVEKTTVEVESKKEQPPVVSEPTSQPEVTTSSAPKVDSKPESATDNELQALEEKNHRLRLMLAEVQSEVTDLKQELGDENRIRSEVEKMLAEERVKREEIERYAPSELDELLSNNWFVAALALIPGLIIALLVMLFLARRSKSESESPQAMQENTLTMPSGIDAVAPIVVGDQALDELEDDLLIDDDLFGSIDNSESLFGEEDKQEPEVEQGESDLFAGLDEEEVDFNLEGDDGEDLFAAIDDSGDLDTGFGISNNGISVGSDEKALGLEEMEQALDNVSSDFNNDATFDLSDDGPMSQADIESLLAADGESEDLSSASLEQSMLDDLFAQQDDSDENNDSFDFDSLFDSNDEEQPTSENETALLDELLDEDETEISSDSTALLDELLEDDSPQDDSNYEMLSELDELLSSNNSDIPDIDENSTELLDDLVGELDEEAKGYDDFLPDENGAETEDDGLGLFDELLNIEQNSEHAQDSEESLSDTLTDNAIETQLSSELDELMGSNEEFVEQDEFDFSPEIESTPAEDSDNHAIANEFGIPQDDDWNFADLEKTEPEASPVEESVLETEDWPEVTEFDTESSEEAVLVDSDLEAATVATESLEELEFEAKEQPDAVELVDTAEFSEAAEEVAIIDSDLDVVTVEAESLEESEFEAKEQPDAAELVDTAEFSEAAEEVALVDSDQDAATVETESLEESEFEAEEQPEVAELDTTEFEAAELPESSEEPAPEEQLGESFEFDVLDLPEYTEEDALADSSLEATTESLEESEPQEQQDESFEFDAQELPEYTEEDALADSGLEAEIGAADSLEEPDPINRTEVNLSDVAKQEFDEQALSDWLVDDQQEQSFSFNQPMDKKVVDSAGMDIDAMLEVGGEDWNGFSLTPDQQATISDDVPEAEQDVWSPEIQVKEPEVAQENWGHQDEFEDIEPTFNQFMSIDDLMAQVDGADNNSINIDDEELKLDVGLNEFPDVIGDVSNVDVDNNAEAAGKLDLAKIYIEMNDDKGAIKLLEEAIVDGNDDIRQQAKHLIDMINGRV